MNSRPQFSLRMLLFGMVIVCVAAATVTELPEERYLGRHIQTAMSVVLSVILPAIFTAGAISSRGYAQSLWIGGLFPALESLMMVTVIIHKADYPMAPEGIADVWRTLSRNRLLIAVAWAMIPGVSLLCLFVRWLLRLRGMPHNAAPLSCRRSVLGLASLVLLAACTATVIVAASPETGYWPHAQGALHLVLTFSLPAVLALVAVQGERGFRAFSLGAAVPAVVEAVYACGITYPGYPVFVPDDRPSLDSLFALSRYVPSFTTLWAASFVFGSAFLVTYWLLHWGQPKSARE